MSPVPTRIATIGTWGHFGQVLSELAQNPSVQLVAHARSMPDDDPAAILQITGNSSVPWHDDYQQMLREVKPDVAIISTQLDRINPIAIQAAQAGCHLICEKPLALNHAGLTQLRKVCISNKVQCISMLGNGRHPVVLAAAGAIQSGSIGEVVLINARKSYKWGIRPDWFGQRETYGTSISWIAIHALEMIHCLTNQNFTSVSAMQSNRVHTERKDCQDNGILLVSLSEGGHASISFDYLRPTATPTHGDDWLRIVGSRGIIEANLDQRWCRLTSNDQPENEIALPVGEPYYNRFIGELSRVGPSAEMNRAFMLARVCLHAVDSADRKTVEVINTERDK